jgi:von Willebrand factor type A domain
MKRPIFAYIYIVLCVFFMGHIQTNIQAANRIFLLDTSGSMKKDGLFERIKETLKSDYTSKMQAGDHIIILTFDEKVVVAVDQPISRENDIIELNRQIDAIQATGLWTWMTKALQMTLEQVKRLKLQYPGNVLNIYFLTDGINDPPPHVNEQQMNFKQTLLKYFKDFKIEDAYVYVLIYGEKGSTGLLTKEDAEELEKATGGRMKINSRSRDFAAPIPPEILIDYSGFNFGAIDSAGDKTIKKGRIKIKELKGNAKGKIINLSSDGLVFKPNDDRFTIKGKGQILEIIVTISPNLAPGRYHPYLELSSQQVMISPNRIPIKFHVEEKPTQEGAIEKEPKGSEKEGWLMYLIFLVLLFIIMYLLFLFLREKTLWIKRNDWDDRKEIIVKGIKKSSLEHVGLLGYHVGFGISPQEIYALFLFKYQDRIEKISPGKPIECHDPEGKDISISFYKEAKAAPIGDPFKPGNEEKQDPIFFENTKTGDHEMLDFTPED